MNNFIEKLTAVVCGAIAGFFGDAGWVVGAMAIFIALDIITGLLKAGKNCALSSSVGRQGLIHKVSELLAVLFGFSLDFVVPKLVFSVTGVQTDICIFGLSIAFYIIIVEALSILENLGECGVSLPTFIAKRLGTYKKSIDDGDSLLEEKEER